MDNTEIHYLTFDPDEVYSEMQLAYVEAGGDVLYPGDEKEMLLRAMQSVIVQVFAGVDNALRMDTLRYAVGEYLDLYGEKRGCVRLPETAATAAVRIVFCASGRKGTLPAGSAMTMDGENVYTLDNDIEYTGVTQTVDASVTCTQTGIAGNGLMSGMHLQFINNPVNVESVTCIRSASGGEERETDETYRERIRTYGLYNVTTGPRESYEREAMAVSSQIIDAHAVMTSPGNVTVYLLLSNQTGASEIVNAVREKLSQETTRPLTDHVSVTQADYIDYSLVVSFSAPGDREEAVRQAADAYVVWQGSKIGRAYNPDMLVAMLYQAGATRVIVDPSSKYAGGDGTVYREIRDSQYSKGTVSLAVIS